MSFAKEIESFWRFHDTIEANEFVNSSDRFTDEKGVVYSTYQKLGKGTGGETFSAVLGDYTVDEIKSKRLKREFLLKIHAEKKGESIEQRIARAKHEFDITMLIDKLGKFNKDEPCKKDAVCAVGFFVDKGKVITVFPYENAVDLQSFLEDEFYETYNSDSVAYKKEVLSISKKLFEAVRRLNVLGIYHRDLKPDNIIVQFEGQTATRFVPHVTSVKLIDFELSCAILEEPFKSYIERQKASSILSSLSCASPTNPGLFVYTAYPMFRDPLSSNGDQTMEKAKKNWKYYEMFASALIVQLLIDEAQNTDIVNMSEATVNNGGVIAIRRTSRSIRGLKDMLDEMTGPIENRGNLGDYALKFEILEADLPSAPKIQMSFRGPNKVTLLDLKDPTDNRPMASSWEIYMAVKKQRQQYKVANGLTENSTDSE